MIFFLRKLKLNHQRLLYIYFQFHNDFLHDFPFQLISNSIFYKTIIAISILI